MKKRVVRLTREEAMDYTENTDHCGGCDGCSKYGQRPCCPPKVKHFRKWPKKKYLYLVMCKINRDEAPETIKSAFYWMCYGHMKTRTRVNRIVRKLTGFHFTVGGCARCTWKKDKTCKELTPALEGIGFRVDRLLKDKFKLDLQWYDKVTKVEPEYYIALAGLYTDEDLPKEAFQDE